MKTLSFDPANYAHRLVCEVFLHHTDAYGHANNTSIAGFMESARFDFFRTIGLFDPKDLFTLPLILVHTEYNFRNIARFNDKLAIYTRVEKIGSSSVTVQQVMLRDNETVIVADGHVVAVSYDHRTNRSRPLSEELRAKLQSL